MKNKSDIQVMLKEAAILFAITLVAGLMLGFVHELTKGRIEAQERKTKEDACRAVFATADSFEETAYEPGAALAGELSQNGVKIGKVYQAKDAAGQLLGYVIETASSEGYGGKIGIYIGVTLDGVLNGTSILEINETVGLGMEAENVLVPQFANKKAEQFTYTKSGSASDNEIDAISGATITTKAFVNAVNGGIKAAEELMEGGDRNE